jgi:hypothetical protein
MRASRAMTWFSSVGPSGFVRWSWKLGRHGVRAIFGARSFAAAV